MQFPNAALEGSGWAFIQYMAHGLVRRTAITVMLHLKIKSRHLLSPILNRFNWLHVSRGRLIPKNFSATCVIILLPAQRSSQLENKLESFPSSLSFQIGKRAPKTIWWKSTEGLLNEQKILLTVSLHPLHVSAVLTRQCNGKDQKPYRRSRPQSGHLYDILEQNIPASLLRMSFLHLI